MSGKIGSPHPSGHDSSGSSRAIAPLPDRPSVEFEKKRARALIDELRSGSQPALVRLREHHPRAAARLPSELQLADAQFLIAREYGFPSWPRLIACIVQRRAYGRALVAIRKRDIDSLSVLVDRHPELVETRADGVRSESLLRSAILHEMREPHPTARAMSDFLVSRGASLPEALNPMLIQALKVGAPEIAWLLDRGADPAWMPRNGIPVLEYALIRYWDGDAVDLIARRVTPREGFWIRAGLGDVTGTVSFLQGLRPDAAARAFRPDFSVMGQSIPPDRIDSSDEGIVGEAFIIAGMNNRAGVLQAFVDRGHPIDYRWLGDMTLLLFAVGNQLPAHVETLLRLGADPDAPGPMGGDSPRQVGRQRFLANPNDPNVRRIQELIAGDRVSTSTGTNTFVRGEGRSPNDPGPGW